MANAPTVVPAILLTPDTVGFLSRLRIRRTRRLRLPLANSDSVRFRPSFEDFEALQW
jgi:hypothetical protein